jgi:4-hydroxythreonine-4-phosphate dehydrogenase
MTNQSLKPRVVVTIGDPAGVGPEVVLKALSDPEVEGLADWVIIGDLSALEKSTATCGIASSTLAAVVYDLRLLGNPESLEFGKLSADCGRAAVEYVRVATEMCLKGEAQGMVTAPLNKEAVTMSGMQFSGHTEYIAELCGATDSRMLLSCAKLSVIHVTTHVPLRNAINATAERILKTIELGDEAMKLMGFKRPRIAVCGLNPHAGEHGLFGNEDSEKILPAIEAARRQDIMVDGPHAPDTIFLLASRGAYDLVVAMYHDQGHIAMKLIDFDQTVNVSLGIPIIRTSVDHGTAFDIAGKNKANAGNMIAALKMGASMAIRKLKQGATIRQYASHLQHQHL